LIAAPRGEPTIVRRRVLPRPRPTNSHWGAGTRRCPCGSCRFGPARRSPGYKGTSLPTTPGGCRFGNRACQPGSPPCAGQCRAGVQSHECFSKRTHALRNLGADAGNGFVQCIDLAELLVEETVVVSCHPAGQYPFHQAGCCSHRGLWPDPPSLWRRSNRRPGPRASCRPERPSGSE
jgi:hypothetical protein